MNSRSDKDIFFEALDLPTAQGRTVFLASACAGDSEQRLRIDELLANHFQESEFMEASAAGDTRNYSTAPVAEDDSGKRIGRYKLLEKLGEGGFGMVFLAEQSEPVRRRVALKILKLGMDSRQIMARFEAERQALALMDHPNIAKVLDAGMTESGRPYFVMELVPGLPITTFCDENDLAMEERLRLFTLVCNAIQHAHQKGVIHRDIKPSNILITSIDEIPVPRVIDFGIAKAVEGRLIDATIVTNLQQLMGTPAYMSPEQAGMGGVDVDTRSDIYSLGVLLYELLTGTTPFDAKKLVASGIDGMRMTIREDEPVSPSTRLSQQLVGADVRRLKSLSSDRPGTEEEVRASSRRLLQIKESITVLRGDLDWIVMRCLEKDRERRYESASDLAADVQRFLANEPVSARPPSAAYRFQKAWRRHRVLYTAGIVTVTALIAGTTVSIWQAVEANGARQSALAAQAAEKKGRLAADAEKTAAQRMLYSVNLPLARAAWEKNDFARLDRLLESTKSYRDRGFEWYYWKRLSLLSYWNLHGHAQGVQAVDLSPDGKRIVTGSADHSAKIWDVESHKLLLALEGHVQGISTVAWSKDGRWIATGSLDHTAKVWNAEDGHETLKVNMGGERVTTVALRPDGEGLAVGGNGGTVILCRLPGGEETLRFKASERGVESVAFSPDGKRIATGSKENLACVWDVNSGKQIAKLEGHADWVNSIAFSPDGNRLATASGDGLAKVWDIPSARQLATHQALWSFVNSVDFSPDGKLVASAGDHWSVNVWNANDGNQVFTHRAHAGEVFSVKFSPDGRNVLSGGGDGVAVLMNFTRSHESLVLSNSSSLRNGAFAFSPDGTRLCAASSNFTALVWDTDSGRELLRLKDTAEVGHVAYSPKGQSILTVAGSAVKLWDAISGKELFTFRGHRQDVSFAEFSPNGREVVSGGADCAIKIWDTATGSERLTIRHANVVTSGGFSPDGLRIVTGCYDRLGYVWDAQTGRLLHALKGHSAELMAVSFSPDGKRIVTAGDLSVRIWDASSGGLLHSFLGHSARVVSAAFSPDGARVVSTADGESVRVWDPLSGDELFSIKGAAAYHSKFSPDGRRLVSRVNGRAVIWTAASPKGIARLENEDRINEMRTAELKRAWETREQALTQIRQRDEGAIKQWLVVAPIPIKVAAGISEESERTLRPKADGLFSLGANGNWIWKRVSVPDSVLDLKSFSGGIAPDSVAYAVTYIVADGALRDLRMLVGTDDRGKVYLNGETIYESATNRGFLADEDVIENVRLDAGLNVLVFKVINDGSDWKGSIRLTDSEGKPVKGIVVRLDSAAQP